MVKLKSFRDHSYVQAVLKYFCKYRTSVTHVVHGHRISTHILGQESEFELCNPVIYTHWTGEVIIDDC